MYFQKLSQSSSLTWLVVPGELLGGCVPPGRDEAVCPANAATEDFGALLVVCGLGTTVADLVGCCGDDRDSEPGAAPVGVGDALTDVDGRTVVVTLL